MRVRITACLLAALLLFGLLPLAGCKALGLKRYQTESFAYFDTVTTVIGYAKSEEAFLEEANAILAELAFYHRLFDIYHTYEGLENLCTVNAVEDGAHRTVKVDRHVIDLLLFGREMHEKSGGALNIGMGSVLSIWHAHREAALENGENATVPDDALLTEALSHTALEKIIIDEVQSTVTITDPLMTLDVGAIAKGYATERVAESMAARGLTHYLLNVGGTVRTVGDRADGKPWVAGIENPNAMGNTPYFAEVAVTDKALSISGTYQRFYTVDGVSYHHIIDTKTAKPAKGYLSVSVLSDDTALADALSTALFCMDIEKGTALLNAYSGTAALWVKEDGTQYKSERFDDFLSK